MGDSQSDTINQDRYKEIVNEILNGLNKEDYHIKCHDCGRFLKKGRWVKKNHPYKAHGLCAECCSNYDDLIWI